MENNTLESKYHKLASEYSKLRAQASVLKKAVLEEQSKSSSLRDQLRQRELSLRRCEQEVDSLGFRNKQLEHRVGSLQEELSVQDKKYEKEQKKTKNKSNDSTNNSYHHISEYENAQDALIFEELQKKIMENAQLTSSLDDKEQELQLHIERIANLEKNLEKRVSECNEMEKRLRREIDVLQSRNSELETKLVEAASIIGSEDALSASGSDNTPLHTTTNSSATTTEERIAFLEKEVSHWRTQCEMVKITETFTNEMPPFRTENTNQNAENENFCNCSSAAAGMTVTPFTNEIKRQNKQQQDQPSFTTTKEQFIFNNFSKKFEDLLRAKCVSESRVSSYEVECEHLQNCLEETVRELKSQEDKLYVADRTIQTLEEDLATTRINYEEQISVLTEQVISLSEQLASCK